VTKEQFDNYRLVLLWYSGDLTHKMCQKMSIDKRVEGNVPEWKQDFYLIYTLNRYIDVFMEFNPLVEGAANTNFFSLEDMKFFEFKINSILTTDFNYDYILTT
jgi:hypothetical protein